MENNQKGVSTSGDDIGDASTSLFPKGLLKAPVLIGISVLLRLLISYTALLPSKLEYRVELTNSLLGLPYIREVAFRLNNGLNPYEYGFNLPSPLLVALLDASSRIWLGLDKAVLILIDTLAAIYLWRIAKWRYGQTQTSVPPICLAIYLFHPFNLMASAAQSAASLLHLALLAGIYYGLVRDQTLAAFWMALATCISPYAIAIMASILAMGPQHKSYYFQVFAAFTAALLVLLLSSWKISETIHFFRSTYWSLLIFESLRPNPGLYWYLCMEMFDFFRPFFTSFLQLHIFFYPLPAFIRFRSDPLFMAWLLIAVHSLFHPQPTASDAALYMSMLALFPSLIPHIRMLPVSLIALCFTTVLAPVNWYFWTHLGSGNANFYYAITLVYSAVHVLLIIDVTRTHVWQRTLEQNPSLTKNDIYQK